MESIRFDERVAIVTGAGRGIGRTHALLLAERGARVVVNDLGSASSGDGSDAGPAEQVAATIRAAGGDAVADASDIATVEGAAQLVRRALDAYGRVDILVNNAGIFEPDEFPTLEVSELRRYFDVHVGGSFNVTRECWPHMVQAGYGRIVRDTIITLTIHYGHNRRPVDSTTTGRAALSAGGRGRWDGNTRLLVWRAAHRPSPALPLRHAPPR